MQELLASPEGEFPHPISLQSMTTVKIGRSIVPAAMGVIPGSAAGTLISAAGGHCVEHRVKGSGIERLRVCVTELELQPIAESALQLGLESVVVGPIVGIEGIHFRRVLREGVEEIRAESVRSNELVVARRIGREFDNFPPLPPKFRGKLGGFFF